MDNVKLFQTLQELSLNWKVEIERNEIKVKLFEGINTKTIGLQYNSQLKELIPNVPKMVYGYVEMKVFDLDKYTIERMQKQKKEVLKYTTAYSNTHFNLHLLRNNYISQKVFEYFETSNQNDIIFFQFSLYF